MTVEYTSDAYFCDPFTNSSKDVLADEVRLNSCSSSASNRNTEDQSPSHNVEADNSVYINRQNSWSSESSNEDKKAFLKLSNDDSDVRCDKSQPDNQTCRWANIANLKHVFVDVHRSMEEMRNSQLVARSNSRVDFLDCFKDITKQRTYHVSNAPDQTGNKVLIKSDKLRNAARRFSV